MNAKLAIKEYAPQRSNIVPLYVEGVMVRQERMLISNIDSLVGQLEAEIDTIDSDGNTTVELNLLGVNIYADIKIRGWSYRSIELLSVEIINHDDESLDNAARFFFNLLESKVQRLNDEAEAFYESC